MKIKHEAKMTIDQNTTFDSMVEAFRQGGVPGNAKPVVEHWPGDQRDPGYTNIVWKWETSS